MASSINTLLLAIDVSKLQNFMTAGAVAPIVIGLVIFRFAANAMIKAFILIVALVLGGLVYTQRGAISDCVDKARSDASASMNQLQCTILVYDFHLDIPDAG